MTHTFASSPGRRLRAGFSLVEMIGVLAIIAILAVVIVPKVFSTIASSRITQTVGSVTSMKAAITEFSGKYGTVPVTTGSANNRLDDLLVTAGMLESRLMVKVGTQPATPTAVGATWTYANGAWAAAGGTTQAAETRLLCRASSLLAPSAAAGGNFHLDGATDLPAGSRVVFAQIPGVRGVDAREISLRMDGDSLSQPDATTADNNGKVVYAAPGGAGTTTVYIYVAHQ